MSSDNVDRAQETNLTGINVECMQRLLIHASVLTTGVDWFSWPMQWVGAALGNTHAAPLG